MRQELSSPIPTAHAPQPRSSQSPIDRVLTWIGVALVAAGTFLGVSKHRQPLVPRARELFVPGGLVLLVLAWRAGHAGSESGASPGAWPLRERG